MEKDSGTRLHSLIRSARFEYALFRWESAVVIALTIFTTAAAIIAGRLELLPQWSWMTCLTFGVVAEAGLIYASMTDPNVNHRVVSKRLQQHFGAQHVQASDVQEYLKRAFDYRARIEAVLRGHRGLKTRNGLDLTVTQIDGWLANICRLAERLDAFLAETRIQSAEKVQVQQRAENLRQQLAAETDTKTSRRVEEMVASLEHQLSTIEILERTIERGQLQLESAVTSLGTIYTQAMLAGARGEEAGIARQISFEISEEAQQIDAVLSAIERIHDIEFEIN
jgi:hypothetical protein